MCVFFLSLHQKKKKKKKKKQSKSKSFFRKRVNPKTLLPSKPLKPANISYWWQACVGYVSRDDIDSCTPEEHAVIDRLIDRGNTLCGVLDKAIVESE